MSWLPMQTVAQISVERILNALPEGLLIALFAWALLRVLRRQNAGTRFAVWFLALLTIAALPLFGSFGTGRPLLASASGGSAFSIPAHWALYIFLAWVFGASFATMRLVAGLWRLRQLRQSCRAIVAADIDPALQQTIAAITASGSITIATSEDVRGPAAMGFWQSTIILPAWALRELPPDDLRVVLLHESAHLRRSDEWTNLIQKIVRALFFFHPAVWWIENRLSVEREMACDDAVLAETSNPRGYANCLVSLLEKSLAHRRAQAAQGRLAQKQWSMIQTAVHRAHEAALRLAQILDASRPKATRVWKPAMAMVGLLSIVCLAAVSQAPQFIAVDRGASAGNSNDNSNPAYVATASAPTLNASFRQIAPEAMVVPAALRTSESSSPMKAKVNPVRVATGQESPPVRTFDASFNAPSLRDRLVAVSANAYPESVPEFQNLVFVETTQYTNSDSSVWSVQVWRVMLVGRVSNRLAKVPVVNSL